MRHVQVRINFHGGSDAGMPNTFAKGGKIKIRIVFVMQIIVGHISVAEAMHRHRMGKTNRFANLSMGL